MPDVLAYAGHTTCREKYSYDNEIAVEQRELLFDQYTIQSHYSSFYDGEHDRFEVATSNEKDGGITLLLKTASPRKFDQISLCESEARIVFDTISTTSIDKCIYCNAKLTFSGPHAIYYNVSDAHSAYRFGEEGTGTDEYSLLESLGVCNTCGWWLHSSRVAKRALYYYPSRKWKFKGHIASATFGKLKSYDIGALDIPLVSLRRHLGENLADVASVHPRRFEALVADCFKERFGHCEVVHIGKVGDGGIDIKLIRGDSIEALVQVKRRSNLAATESVQVVRELNGVLLREGVSQGMVVTTASKFSRAAVSEAASTARSLARYKVDLIALPEVVELLRGVAASNVVRPSDTEIESFAYSGWRDDAVYLAKSKNQ